MLDYQLDTCHVPCIFNAWSNAIIAYSPRCEVLAWIWLGSVWPESSTIKGGESNISCEAYIVSFSVIAMQSDHLPAPQHRVKARQWSLSAFPTLRASAYLVRFEGRPLFDDQSDMLLLLW